MEKQAIRSKKIRKGDKVVAITGNNKGQTGTVQSVSGDKVLVHGLNVKKKSVKKSQQSPQGGFIDIEKPIHVSNLKVIVEGMTAAKLKVRANPKGERQFVYNSGDKEVVYRSVNKPK